MSHWYFLPCLCCVKLWILLFFVCTLPYAYNCCTWQMLCLANVVPGKCCTRLANEQMLYLANVVPGKCSAWRLFIYKLLSCTYWWHSCISGHLWNVDTGYQHHSPGNRSPELQQLTMWLDILCLLLCVLLVYRLFAIMILSLLISTDRCAASLISVSL